MEKSTLNSTLRGSAVGLFLYDVCEEIKLDELRAMLGARRVAEGLKHAAAEQIYFERPPVVEQIEPPPLPGGEQLQVQVKYYDYGVISIVLQFPFAGRWEDLISLSSSWISRTDFETYAEKIARTQVKQASTALVKPYAKYLSEDYFVFLVREISENPSAANLLSHWGQEITQVVRGETAVLAEGERSEILQSAISYYPNDLVVVGWNAAFVYDSAAGSQTALELLEYANSQLLEFRHYDDLLTRELAAVYESLGRGTGFIDRWRLPKVASRLQAMVLEVGGLTERVDNAIKFLSDMFSARLYRLAATKIGVLDYKNLVNEKLRSSEGLYRFLIDQFNQGRSFVLELMVVIILVIELIYVFRGKI